MLCQRWLECLGVVTSCCFSQSLLTGEITMRVMAGRGRNNAVTDANTAVHDSPRTIGSATVARNERGGEESG